MNRHASLRLALSTFAVLAVGLAGCKGETTFKDNPDTLGKLDNCTKAQGEKDKLIKDYEAEIARLQRDAKTAGEISIAFENDVLTVKAPRPGTAPPIDEKQAAAASKQFIDLVQRSRGSIQRCYVQALKKDSSLQARTITLTVVASFADSGALRSTSFSPSLGGEFDGCMTTVASKWSMPTNTPAMSFRAPVSLTPS